MCLFLVFYLHVRVNPNNLATRWRAPVDDIRELTSGPGKLSTALSIDKGLHGVDFTTEGSEVFIVDDPREFEVGTSHRVGVKRDLEEELRFSVKGNRFVLR